MGSGSKRKGNDVVRINTPQVAVGAKIGNGIAGGQGANAGEQIDINQACPLAFSVKLKQRLANGIVVTISGDSILVGAEVIGKLSPARSKQINFCMSSGIQYAGKTESDKNGSTRVRFEQIR